MTKDTCKSRYDKINLACQCQAAPQSVASKSQLSAMRQVRRSLIKRTVCQTICRIAQVHLSTCPHSQPTRILQVSKAGDNIFHLRTPGFLSSFPGGNVTADIRQNCDFVHFTLRHPPPPPSLSTVALARSHGTHADSSIPEIIYFTVKIIRIKQGLC